MNKDSLPIFDTKPNLRLVESPFISLAAGYCKISSGARAHINLVTITAKVKKGELLVTGAANNSNLYFVRTGVLRGYTNIRGKELTNWIASEGEVAICNSIQIDQPTIEDIQALENCEVCYLNFEDLEYLYENFSEMNVFARKVLETHYSKMEEEMYVYKTQDSEFRYEYFERLHENLAGRIPLKIISTYLGIAPETLSRIRRLRSKK